MNGIHLTRMAFALGLVAWLGSMLLLAEWRWIQRRDLAERLAPHTAGSAVLRRRAASARSARDLLAPLWEEIASTVATGLGVKDSVAERLHRTHSRQSAADFRSRQLTLIGLALIATAALTRVTAAPAHLATAGVVAAPALAFLVSEQRLTSASDQWRRDIAAELPVLAEQVAILLDAGHSMGGALGHVADRGAGRSACDIRRLLARRAQGLSLDAALCEWRDGARVVGVDSFVEALTLNREAADVGRLVADEARALRHAQQRALIADLDRRSQQVWVPVTVAALVPGVLLISVPFLDALSGLSG